MKTPTAVTDTSVELAIANQKLAFQNAENEKKSADLFVANAQLKNSEHELLKKYQELTDYKHALDESAIVEITDQSGIIRHINDNFCNISKYTREELIGQHHRIVNSGYHSKEFLKNKWNTLSRGIVWKGDIRNKAKDGTYYWVDTTIVPFLDEKGAPYQFVSVRADITEKRRAEEQLEFDRINLDALINNTNDLMWSVDRQFNLITSNKPFEEICKVSFGKVILKGESVLSVSYSEEMSEHFRLFYERAFAGESFTEIEHFDIPAESWTEISYYPIRSGTEIIGTACHSRDITFIKNAEAKILISELQIRNFAKHLSQAQEEERAHIAREIHDELGQELVGIKIELSSFLKSIPALDKITVRVKEMIGGVDNAMHSLRKIATQLRPGILDSLGLIPSIEWLGKEFEKKTGIECKMDINIREKIFEKNISICFFRICQEALTNISKHAGSDKVTIHMSERDNELTLIITDNGKGMTEEKLKNPFSMGLLGMKERAGNIGGYLSIRSKANAGTTIQITAPV